MKKKLLILGMSLVFIGGIAATTISIVNQKIDKKIKTYSSQEKIHLVKEKINYLDINNPIFIENDENLDLSKSNNREIVKNHFIKKINTSLPKNANHLTKDEKNSIIFPKKGLISNWKLIMIKIKINFGTLSYEYDFNFKRLKSQSEINFDKVSIIKSKIKNTNLIIDKHKDISSNEKILSAIKYQLKYDNILLTNNDLNTITDNISSLNSGVNTNVTLTITVGSKSDTIDITINRPLNDVESVTKAKEAINSLSTKEIIISSTSGTITSNKAAILTGLETLSGYSSLDLKGATISIEDEATTLTNSGITFTIIITKNSANTEITSGFTIKRSKTNEETNNDQVAAIKTKIKDTNLLIDKDVDTSDDAKILAAIKTQLQIDNSTLLDGDLAKITDNISSLTPGVNTNVTLTITVNGQSDTINIIINRSRTDIENKNKALFDKVVAYVDGAKAKTPRLFTNRTWLGINQKPYFLFFTNPKVFEKIQRSIATFKKEDPNTYQIPTNEKAGFIFDASRKTLITYHGLSHIRFKIKFGNYEKQYTYTFEITTD